jgi:hypothetical protein
MILFHATYRFLVEICTPTYPAASAVFRKEPTLSVSTNIYHFCLITASVQNTYNLVVVLSQEPCGKPQGMLAQREYAVQATATPMASVDKGAFRSPL